MNTVWFVHHIHQLDSGYEDTKLIGVFKTREEAEAARVAVANKPGFRDFPDGFEINEHHMGRIGWVDGFAQVD